MDHALVYLGQKKLVKFVISAAIKSFFDQAGMGYLLCKGGIYHHAVGTAIIAKEIARITEKAEPALAYTGGLLHDIGKVVLDQHIQAGLPLFTDNYTKREKTLLKLKKLFSASIIRRLVLSWLNNGLFPHHSLKS